MDWYVETENPGALPALRHAVARHLRRHATPDSDLDAAELVVSEIITNAIEHSGGPVWISLDWGGEQPELTVRDLGPGFELPTELVPPPPEDERGRGLFIVAALTGDLRVASRRAGGSEVCSVLPVRRAAEPSYDPPRRSFGELPDPSEASEDGTFGKQSFLRALVVQLAQILEEVHGPTAAEAGVAQVGTDVGGRMEDAYRRAGDIEGRLTPEQMADLYVRLKAAIDGDFYVIELSDERIVLGNPGARSAKPSSSPPRSAG